MRKPFKNRIIQVKNILQANEKQMARHLRISLADYKAIESGAKVLPLPAQKTIERRMERLLELCGLK
jgi:DNA-binding XRE family transcriptional regulator